VVRSSFLLPGRAPSGEMRNTVPGRPAKDLPTNLQFVHRVVPSCVLCVLPQGSVLRLLGGQIPGPVSRTVLRAPFRSSWAGGCRPSGDVLVSVVDPPAHRHLGHVTGAFCDPVARASEDPIRYEGLHRLRTGDSSSWWPVDPGALQPVDNLWITKVRTLMGASARGVREASGRVVVGRRPHQDVFPSCRFADRHPASEHLSKIPTGGPSQ
jgi:hypothetical protein